MDYQPPLIIAVSNIIVTGDSIATGIGHNGRRGSAYTDAEWGRSPSWQYDYMRNKGSNYYRGKEVVLSTGILNSEDWTMVEEQFRFLRDSKPLSVSIVGTPFASYNFRLSELCQRYGFTFLGGYTAGPDGIHPVSYEGLY